MTRIRRRLGTIEYLKQQSHVSIQPKEHKGRWNPFFKNDHPIHVELGMGKGQFIYQLAQKYPDINFIGIDMYDELIRKASEKVTGVTDDNKMSEAVAAPGNLALLLWNIEKLEDVFAENEIERIYLNFSDPWPKNRHEKRRLTHHSFMEKYMKLLNGQGEIHLKTDSVSLFEFSLNVFAGMNLTMRNISLDLHREGTPEEHVFTEYEEKFVSQGIRIHRVEVIPNHISY